MLPAEAYTSEAVLAWERATSSPVRGPASGRVDVALPDGATQRGDHRRATYPSCSSRDAAGEVAAFANTCRHRGHELLPDGATSSPRRRRVPATTPGATTSTASLIVAPGFEEVASFDPAAHGLVRLPVEVWHGWLFVDALGSAGPFADHVGGLEDAGGAVPPECTRARCDARVRRRGELEGHHRELPRVLPLPADPSGAVRRVARRPAATTTTCREPGSAARWTCATHAETMSLDGSSGGRAIDGVDPGGCSTSGCSRTCCISLHPDYVMTHRMTPLAPGETRVECAWYFSGRATPTRRTPSLLGPHEPTGLGSVRVGAARPSVAALPPRTAGPERGRGARVRDDDRARLPGRRPQRLILRCTGG